MNKANISNLQNSSVNRADLLKLGFPFKELPEIKVEDCKAKAMETAQVDYKVFIHGLSKK